MQLTGFFYKEKLYGNASQGPAMADVRYGVISEKADSDHSCDHVHDPSHELDHHRPLANDQDCQNDRDPSSVHDHDQDNQR